MKNVKRKYVRKVPANKRYDAEILQQQFADGMTYQEAASFYNVSRQRMYKVVQQYGITTVEHRRKAFLKGKPHKYHWLNRTLRSRGLSQITKKERLEMLETIDIPDICPILGLKLRYEKGEGKATEHCPSIDQIAPGEGYSASNVQVISLRANQIKSDASWQELLKIGNYMRTLVG